MYKQYIVVNKELNMSHGKMSAQVAHASMAFLSRRIGSSARIQDTKYMVSEIVLPIPMYNDWFAGSFTKIVLQADNIDHMKSIIQKAIEKGLIENKDFYCIRDNCLTELTPDETGTCWTAIGFVPTETSFMHSIVGDLKTYK